MKKNWFRHVGFLFVVFSLLFNPILAAPVYALSAPGLAAPTNGATITPSEATPLGIPEFEWTAVSGATSYRLQVSSDIAFTTQIVNITTPNTSYTPSAVGNFSDGVWYWRVRAESPAPSGSYSATWMFTKQWAEPANSPALISPADGATLNFYDEPVFSWSPVTGAAKYKLQIYSSPGGWASLTYAAVTLATSHQPPDKFSNGIYYWRVVPLDAYSREGTPSAERSFVAGYNHVPTLIEPADNANPTFTPTFRWLAVRGAQYYRLQYTTDPSFGANVTTVDTRNTAHTPLDTISNDVNYYWRVRAVSGISSSDWSPSRSFLKKWYIKPVLLTPTNSYQHLRFPIFNWTPVPGAARYLVEISKFPGFNPLFDSGYTANTFYSPTKYEGSTLTYYWRVTPYDGNNQAGVTSLTSSYVSYAGSVAPHPVYPLYYYPPDLYSGFPGVTTNPHEDRTAPLPIFIWHRVLRPFSDPNPGEVYAQAYRLQVSTDSSFATVNWTVDTENTVAAPTMSNSFVPLPNKDYYWRVRPLISGAEAGQWSQVYKTRFDLTKGLTPTPVSEPAPTLIRPTTGFEYAETTPLLEWFPMQGASSYDVQISRDGGFTDIVDSATVSYPAYAPTQSLAQRSLGDTDFGSYYWRVRKSSTNSWSEIRRFQIAAQSQWKFTRALGATANRLQIGSDSPTDVVGNYALSTLQAAQSGSAWVFGFHVPPAPTQNVTYALYLDLDHVKDSGASFDARGYTVTTIGGFRPEYAIYVLQEGGLFNASKAYLYHWNGIDWDTAQPFDSIGGLVYHDAQANYLEIQLGNTSIGYGDTTGSYAISLFSLPASSGQPQDSVPSDPSIPGTGPISRFSNVTERMNLVMPPNDAGIDPSTYPSILPFFWDYPIAAPYSGAIMKSYLDPLYTTEASTYTLETNAAYWAQNTHAWGSDFKGDNTYYWRVQARYRDVGCSSLCSGAWSQGWRFERQGFIPQNLKTSVTFATPTFSWDMVEGAESYELQVDTDPGFPSPEISKTTRQNSYTLADTLGNGTYNWRVRVIRNGNVANNWTASQSFTLSLPSPTNLNHVPSGVPSRAPTLCWTPLLVNGPSNEPVLAAWKYRVQVSKDAAFSNTFDTIDTEQSCWTPTKGYDDGQYYWRVAMMDGLKKLGNYSSPQTFTKQYLTTTLLSPTSGASETGTPTFVWTPVNGAARYKVEVSLFPNFSPLYDSVTTDNVRWTPTKVYNTAGTYYWRVAMLDSDNKIGPYVGSTIIISDGKVPVSVYIGSTGTPIGSYSLDVGQSLRQSYAVNNGPVRITSSLANIIGAERVIYKVNGFDASYSEMMGLPNNQLDTTYWLPWYNNKELDTQLRFANVSNAQATVSVSIGGQLMPGSPFTLAPGESTRKSFVGVNNGPVRITSTQNIVVAERLIYKVNNVPVSFSEMMALPNNQLDTTYWLPWYNNKELDTQLRFANVSDAEALVHVYIGGVEMQGSPYQMLPGASLRKSFVGVNDGPVQIVSDQNIVAAERLIFKVNGVDTSYSEMMALPNSRLSTMYWLPWYNNKELDTQLRFANVSTSTASVHVYMGGVEMPGSPFTLAPGASTRQSFVGVNSGPVKIQSDQNIVAAERLVYKADGVNTSFIEMMGLPNEQLDSTYWLPWYNNTELNTQLRFGVP